MIGGFVENSYWDEVYEIFCKMLLEGVVLNRVVYLSIFNFCVCFGGLFCGKEVYVWVMNVGFMLDERVGNVFINMYFKVGSVEDVC